MVVFTHLIKDLRCFIFMKNRVIFFPDVNMIFSDTQKYRDIFLRDNVPLAENRVFCDTFNDLGNVVAENLTDRIFCFYQFHEAYAPFCFYDKIYCQMRRQPQAHCPQCSVLYPKW